MPTQDLVHYRSEDTYPVVRGGSSDNSSLFLGSGAEDWVTRKRVETKTTKNIERRVQRQVVLEDGRVIEEDDPEIVVDTIEDTQSHDEDGDEDRKHFFNETWAVTPRNSTWSANDEVLSERNQRNTFTKNIFEKSVTTASATNLGDISSKDVDKVIRHGKRTRQFIRPHDDDSSSTDPISLPAKVIHTGKSNRILVDREDVREIDRLHEGKVKTERHVTREMIEDIGDETPEEGDSTEETESRDGDRDGFAQRKEERFVDYYRVPKGKSLKDGQFVGHGIHMTSHDKTDRKGQGISALAYHRDDRSDSTPPGSSGGWPSRPPRSSDHQRKKRSSSASGKRGVPSRPIITPAPSTPRGTPRGTPDRYNTIERSTWKNGSRELNGARSVSTLRDSRDHSTYRSRSISRSPQPFSGKDSPYVTRSGGGSRNGDNNSHHRSMTTLRTDLDDEREGRLKRAMSFSSKSVGPLGGGGGVSSSRASTPTRQTPAPSNTASGGLLGSVKTLYATIRRKNGKENSSPKDKQGSPDKTKFDHGKAPPQRPPRKHQSSSSVTSGNSGQFNSLDRRGYHHKSEPKVSPNANSQLDQRWAVYPQSQPQQQVQQTQHHSRQAHQSQVHTSSHHSASGRESTPTRREVTPKPRQDRRGQHGYQEHHERNGHGYQDHHERNARGYQDHHERNGHHDHQYNATTTSSFVLSPGSVGSGRQRSTHSSRYDDSDNRDAPRFEPERHRDRSTNSRFFGQSDEDELNQQDRARPPPDMRRLLLNNVNINRSKSMSKDLDAKPHVIRAI